MGTKRERITFQRKSSRPPITREEYLYYKDLFPKILKIGTEFEMNLRSPEDNLQSKGEEPCVHSDKPCVVDCANLERCLVDRHPTFCLTRDTGKFLGNDFSCPAADDQDFNACKKCPAWALLCRGLSCSMHTPFCTVCPNFERKGRNVENADIRKDAASVREEVSALLNPTNFIGHVGKTGALEVTKDGSLTHGGIEVPTVGRRVHWQSFYNMSREILDVIVGRGGFTDERCGQHFHVLTGYFPAGGHVRNAINELEEPMPEIILANHHQLVRRYELALFWLMSTGKDVNSLTRWAKFRMPVFQFSALSNRMNKVQEEIARHVHSPQSNGKYASVALHLCKFQGDNKVSTFHIENRIPDGCLAPSVITAWAMLCYAMVLKALNFSQYGIMEIGDREYSDKVKEISPLLINGQDRDYGNQRSADTSMLQPYIPWLRDNARELIQLLKSDLGKLGPSFDILMSLADRPVSVRRTSRESWEQIEEELYGSRLDVSETTPLEIELREVVDLTTILECQSLDTWTEETAAHLGQSPVVVADAVRNMIEGGGYQWCEAIGTLVTSS